MPIDAAVALSAQLEPAEFSWNSSDVQLYQLALGAGRDPMDPRELRYLTDDTPQVLPTFGNVAQSFHDTAPPTVRFPGIDIELSRVLHASEAVTVPGPIPPSGTGIAVTRFTDIWDKGKAAVIWSETTVKWPGLIFSRIEPTAAVTIRDLSPKYSSVRTGRAMDSIAWPS